MSFFIEKYRNMANVAEPAGFSLSANPNFVQIESKGTGGKPAEITLNIKGNGYAFMPPEIMYWNMSSFNLVEEKTGKVHSFMGISDLQRVNDETYYIGPLIDEIPQWDAYQTAFSLKETLLKNAFISEKYDVSLPPTTDSLTGEVTPGRRIKLKAKGFGDDYAFRFEYNSGNATISEHFFLSVEATSSESENSDSIAEGSAAVEIHLDLYKDTGIFPGTDDAPNEDSMGSYVTTLTKSYSGTPLWFNVNVLSNKDYSPGFLDAGNGWFDTGTVRDFRFALRRHVPSRPYEDGTFFYSNVLYAIAGCRRMLEQNDLSAYVYNTSTTGLKMKPLTTLSELPHVRGQAQYFNFLLADAAHGNQQDGNLAITCRIFSQSARTLAVKVMHILPKHLFHAVNTIRLGIDEVIAEYPTAGLVEVSLSRSLPGSDTYIEVSEPLRFRILPECLYKVNDFAFLNSLGGWSSFNFPGMDSTDFKATNNTVYLTHTPGKTISSRIEAVYSKEVEEQFTVQTMPLSRRQAEWLKELSTSTAVYELATGRYVIVDELNIKPNSKDELFRLDMKYHYSDR